MEAKPKILQTRLYTYLIPYIDTKLDFLGKIKAIQSRLEFLRELAGEYTPSPQHGLGIEAALPMLLLVCAYIILLCISLFMYVYVCIDVDF